MEPRAPITTGTTSVSKFHTLAIYMYTVSVPIIIIIIITIKYILIDK